jgi:hypothetical protein
MRWPWTATLALSGIFAGTSVYAAQYERWTLFGLRPLAMGNAYVAVADDYNALFYNPAGLARLKSWDGELLNPAFDASTNFKGLLEDAQKNLTSGSTSDTLGMIQRNTGENFHVGLQLVPHLIFPHFGFGIGLDTGATAVFHRDVNVDIDVGLRAIVPVSFAMNFLDDRLSVGVTGKVRVRAGVDQNFSIDDIEAFSDSSETAGAGANTRNLNDYVKAGIGYGADVGMLFTATRVMEPTFGMSITDIGGTPFEKFNVPGDTVGKPSTQLPSVNLGFSVKPIQREWTFLQVSADMHSINQPYSFSKKFGLGLEGGLGSVLKLQTGLYQGYPTAGFLFDIGIINVKLITYAEELGNVAGYKPDRRYAAQIKLIL